MNRRTPYLQTRAVKTPTKVSTKVSTKVPRITAFVVKNRRREELPSGALPAEVDPRPASPLPPLRLRLLRLAKVWALLLIAGPVGAALLLLVSERLEVMRLGYELAQVSREQDKLLQQNRELRVEAASLRAPPRVADVAAKDFSMSVPEPSRVIVLDPGGAEILPLPPPPPDLPDLSGGHLVE